MNLRPERARLALASALLTPLAPALWLYTIYRSRVLKKSPASTRGMWGHLPPSARLALRSRPTAPVIWMHAVSVGEVMAARVVARALRQVLAQRQVSARLFLSVTTDTGMETARAALKSGEVDAVGFYPIDAPAAVKRALNAVRPSVFVTLETELWPLFLSACRARGVRTLLANGRVSDRLARDGARLGFLFGPMLRGFSALLMRSPFDRARMKSLAGSQAQIFVAGDVKLDAVEPGSGQVEAAEAEAACWKQQLGVAPEQLLWAAGSTHPGEEELLARVYKQLKAEFPALRLLLAPRHTERAGEVLALLRGLGLAAVLRSESNSGERQDAVIVLDSVGELAQIYGCSAVAFVGGSLIERGGHNLLEPVLRGVPVAFGPHVANFRVAAALAQEHGLGRMVHDEGELSQALASWLHERQGTQREAARAEFAARVEVALRPHRGASRRVARAIVQALLGEEIEVDEAASST